MSAARFQGKRVLVTAGAAGIGRAFAQGFGAEGAEVAICDADAAAVDALRADAPPGLVEAAVVDVTDEAGMDAFLGGLETRWGGVDVVCANAGIGGPAGRIEDLALADWARCVEVNLVGAFLTCRWAARLMRAQGAGALILTSSTAGLWGYPLRSPYAAAKWGIVGLAKTLASELGPVGVRVNAICPGSVHGDRMERVLANEARARGVDIEEVRAAYVAGVAMKTWISPEEIADTAMFLASDAARHISGQALAVDGHTETRA